MVPQTKVFVGSLPPGSKPQDLRRIFERFGVVTECDIMNRCGFVHMQTEEMASEAIKALDNTSFNGALITVERGRIKERGERGPRNNAPRSPMPPRGMGGSHGPMRSAMGGPRSAPYDRRPPMSGGYYDSGVGGGYYDGGPYAQDRRGFALVDDRRMGGYGDGGYDPYGAPMPAYDYSSMADRRPARPPPAYDRALAPVPMSNGANPIYTRRTSPTLTPVPRLPH